MGGGRMCRRVTAASCPGPAHLVGLRSRPVSLVLLSWSLIMINGRPNSSNASVPVLILFLQPMGNSGHILCTSPQTIWADV